MFVSEQADNLHGEVDVGSGAGLAAHGSPPRGGVRETTVVDGLGAQGWACPHCAVENRCTEDGAGDVVECDYCGRAFAPCLYSVKVPR